MRGGGLMKLVAVVAVILGTVAIGVPGSMSAASGDIGCAIEQITQASGQAPLSHVGLPTDDGETVILQSIRDLAGDNPGSSWDVFEYDRSSGDIAAITHHTGGRSAFPWAVTADGDQVLMTANTNPLGTNADRNTELFIWDRSANAYTEQLTDTGTFSVGGPFGAGSPNDADMSADGRWVAFSASYDIDDGNEDGNAEIYLLDRLSDTIDQLTTTDVGSIFYGNYDARVSDDGARVAFETEVDGSSRRSIRAAVVLDTASGEELIEPIEAQPGHLDLSADGSVLALTSEYDLTDAPDGGIFDLYAVDVDDGSISQVTSGQHVGSILLSADGSTGVVAFPRRPGELGSTIRLLDLVTGAVIRDVLTDYAGGFSYLQANRDLSSLVFDGTYDPVSRNPDADNELFVMDTATPCGPQPCGGRATTVNLNDGDDPTGGADVILGTMGIDQVDGLGGDDVFCGFDGNDRFFGGPGADSAIGGRGTDEIRGGAGNDRLSGSGGNDRLYGGEGNDRLTAYQGNDLLDGGNGADRLDGGPNRDQCLGRRGRDIATACEIRSGIP